VTELRNQYFELFESGFFQEVINRAQKEENLTAEIEQLLAASYFKIGNYTDCLTLLETLEGSFGSDPNFNSLYGAALRRVGLKKEAKIKLENAINLSNNDNPHIINNYANLLVDMGNSQEAVEILENIVKNNPDYLDAKINLERAKKINKSTTNPSTNDEELTDEKNIESELFIDPLMAAFSTEEVELNNRSRSKSIPNKSITAKKYIKKEDKSKLLIQKLELLKQCLDEKNYSFGLQLCSELNTLNLAKDLTYKYASDCYIGLKRFNDAEIFLLHSIVINPDSLASLINLVSICALKGDLGQALLIYNRIKDRSDLDANQKHQLEESIKSRDKELKSKYFNFV